MDELRYKAVNYDIVGITESWGNTDIADAELNISVFICLDSIETL